MITLLSHFFKNYVIMTKFLMFLFKMYAKTITEWMRIENILQDWVKIQVIVQEKYMTFDIFHRSIFDIQV